MPSRVRLAGSTGQRASWRGTRSGRQRAARAAAHQGSEAGGGRGGGRHGGLPPGRPDFSLPMPAHGLPPHILLNLWGAGLPSFRPHRVCTSLRAEEPSGVRVSGARSRARLAAAARGRRGKSRGPAP